MRRFQRFLAVLAAAGLAVGVAGCVESDPDAAATPDGVATVTNSAPQTDADGNTVPAPGADTPTGGEEGGGDADPAVAAGQEFFGATCGGCHAALGQEAGVGPKLAGAALAEDLIRTTIQNGRGAMPPGLASGEDLDNVVAYVLSIQ